MNLALNARDALPSGGELRLETRAVRLDSADIGTHAEARAGRYVRLRVADTGVGIPEEHLEKIFDPFFTTKDVGEGTGLGLATVHGIVSQCGGHIEVASRRDRGTTIDVYLQVSDQETAPVPVVLPLETRAQDPHDSGLRRRRTGSQGHLPWFWKALGTRCSRPSRLTRRNGSRRRPAWFTFSSLTW